MEFHDPKFISVHHRNVWGEWTFVFEKGFLCRLQFQGGKVPSSVHACVYASPDVEATLKGKTASIYKKIIQELNLYLSGKIKAFTIPLKIYGTDFQVKVLKATQEIPYGETRTYKQIAQAIGKPDAVRAVGNVLHNNPLQIIIPCHRVISSNGKLSGYTLGTDIKRRLLCIEGALQDEFLLE